ncbi:MAG: EAL domain-containing protein [Dactylosporangium sp.]|nr:EAL domain-containing protein [Dactylosporangium sp.]
MVRGEPNPYPSPADVVYLAMYPLMTMGLYGLVRSGARNRDRIGLLDSLTLTSAVALFSWVFLISPYIGDPSLAPIQKTVSIAYPIGDVLVLAMMARLVTMSRNTVSVTLLTVGGVCLLATDIVYGLLQVSGLWQIGTPIDLGWVVSYAAFGAAAIHPSMRRLTEPRLLATRAASGPRVLLLALSSLIPPALLFMEAIRGSVRDGVVIAVLSAMIFMLVHSRLWAVVELHRRASGRERALREAGAALVVATELEQVASAVRIAVRTLLPAGTNHQLAFVLEPRPPSLVEAGRREPTGAPRHVPTTGAAKLCYTRELDPGIASQLRGFEIALRCSLRLEDGLGGDPSVGMMALGAAEATLVGLEGAVDVLAAQAAMAIERIALSTEIYRRRSEEYFRTLVINMSDVLLILGEDDSIRYASPSATGLFRDQNLIQRLLSDLVCAEERSLAAREIASARVGEISGRSRDWRVLRVDEDPAQVEVSFQDLRHDPTVSGLVVTLRDVTERRRLERELTYQAFHDSLTGLANRALFAERLERAIAQCGRRGLAVGVLVIDLDDFKVINDTIGHGLGDELLATVGRRLASSVRSHDTVARLGGDEFAILVEGAGGAGEIERVAIRALGVFSDPVPLKGQMVTCAASVGLTVGSGSTDEGQELLSQADLALYMAKSAGKGRSVRYQPALHSAMRERLELRAELDQSLTDGDFVLHYQPIVELSSGEPVGVEALVRWIHPIRGTVSPGQFIDVAEESGLIIPLGSWVMREAIASIARWREESVNGRQPYVSVNVSASQFRAPGFVDQVMANLLEFDLPPSYLLLEITESLLLRDDEQVWTDLLALRGAGVRVAIDDFGTGYSSLSYLRQVPIDIVKIDKSFVETVSTSKQQRALVDGIIGLTHTLGLEVVAEGIEQSTEREILCEIGCRLGQGFLFARPMSYGDAVAWMRAVEVPA